MKREGLVVALAVSLLVGCSISHRRAGVANRWQVVEPQAFERGKTTMGDVLALLGPPSHILKLGEDDSTTVLYYLLEEDHTEALTLMVFNYTESRVRYDRAVFFFDGAGTLEEYAVSHEALPQEPPEE